MKPKTVVLLAVAVGSGLLAMLGVQQAMSNPQVKQEETVSVLVATQDVEVGVLLTPENTAFQSFPISAVPQDPVLKPEEFEKRSPNYALRGGDIIRQSKLSEPGVFGKSIQIKEGMRVVSIPVDDTQTISGLLSPGDRVDVLVTYSHRDQRGQQVTKAMTLLEFVEIFATDDKTQREATAPGGNDAKNKTRTVALLLAPEHIPFVILAQSKGKLSLSWRRRDDDTVASVGSINEQALDELKGIAPMGGGFGDRPGYDRSAAPLYGDSGEDFPTTAGNFDFPGSGEAQPPKPAAQPTQAANPFAPPTNPFGPPAGQPGTGAGGVDAMLSASEAGPAPATAPQPTVAAEPAVPAPPPKPTWKIAILNGTDQVDQEFEIPEEAITAEAETPTDQFPVPSAGELKEVHDAAGGSKIWDFLKQAL